MTLRVAYRSRVAFCPQCKKITNQTILLRTEYEVVEKVIECGQCGQTLGYETRKVEKDA